jgi:uncharacterized protein (TIGR02217 family)
MAADPLFLNARLNEEIEQGAKGGPGFLTTVLPLASGHEKRNQEWELQRLAWDVGYGMQTKGDYESILAFFYNCAGQAHGFRFRDWTDYQIGVPGTGQLIHPYPGSTSVFQASRLYQVSLIDSTVRQYFRKVTRLSGDNYMEVYVSGVLQSEGADYQVNYNNGQVHFLTQTPADGTVRMAAEFDVPVRFDADKLDTEVTWSDAMSMPSILIIELKE